jgi:hypothetical protein
MEAIRVRAAANGDTVGVFDFLLEDHELGLAVPAVETGTLNRSASILMRIPTEGGHRFRTKAAIESDGKRPPIPGESGHRFRSKAATLWIG